MGTRQLILVVVLSKLVNVYSEHKNLARKKKSNTYMANYYQWHLKQDDFIRTTHHNYTKKKKSFYFPRKGLN